MIARAMLALALAAMPLCSNAQQPKLNSGNYWVSRCDAAGQPFFECVVFTAGAVGGLQAMMTEKNKYFCLPEEMTFAQAAYVFGKYLRQHPEETHLDAAQLVGYAMISSYPCPKK